MTIRGVVFDIGGVLEYTPYTGWWERWHERLGLEADAIDIRLMERGLDGGLGTCTEAAWLNGLREITGMNQSQMDEFMSDLWEEYLGTLNVELVEYVRGLRPRFQTGILSNSFLGAREKEQEHYGFEDLVDVLIYSHEVGLAKPDRRIYELTCERLGLKPEEIVFVDDVDGNIEGARAVGMRGILFKDNGQVIGEIEECIREYNSETSKSSF
jgi:putative hydrolase of the HAD superfamily